MEHRPGSEDMLRRARRRLTASPEAPPAAQPPLASAPEPPPAPAEEPAAAPPEVAVPAPPQQEPAAEAMASPSLAEGAPAAEAQVDQSPGTAAEPSRLQRLWAHRWIAVAVIVGLSIVGNPFDSSESVVNLAEGDCFQSPPDLEVSEVDVVACDSRHDYEVISILEHTAAEGAPYPGEGAMYDWSLLECVSHFEGYVGIDYMASELWLWPMVPTEGSWDDGDRGAICVLYASPDGFSPTPLSTSLRGSNR